MRIRVLLHITGDDGAADDAMEVAAFEKRTERPEDIGLSIADGKALMTAVQQRVVNGQVASWTEQHRWCEACSARRRSKGSHPVVFFTLYGDVQIASPRLHRCPCQGAAGPATVSPLRNLLPDYVVPEQSKPSKTTWTDWKSTTRTCANSPSRFTNSQPISSRTREA